MRSLSFALVMILSLLPTVALAQVGGAGGGVTPTKPTEPVAKKQDIPTPKQDSPPPRKP